jgi:UDP-glucose 4-epimerase
VNTEEGWIAVTGATGWIGREVCKWLEKEGLTVRRLDRTQNVVGVFPLDLAAAPSDSSWADALRGCATVVHCAGHVHRPVETAEERRLFHEINVEGMRKLLATCRSTGTRRVVFVSSSAVYDWNQAEPVKEMGALRPTTAYAASKLEAERLVRESGLDWRIVRLATVFGQGDRANFARLASALRSRRFVIPGHGQWQKSVLPINWAGELLGRMAVAGTEAKNATVNLAAPMAPTLSQICDGFSQACGFPQARHVPLVGLKVAASIGDAAQRLRLPFLLNSETLRKLTTSTVLDVSKMQALFPEMTWPTFAESLRSCADYYAQC